MANALDAVLQLRANEAARQQNEAQAISHAVDLFTQARQNAQENQFRQLQLAQQGKYQDATIANQDKQLAQDQPVKDAQVQNYISEAKSRQGQENLANLIKGSQLKKAGQETKDKSIYDAGEIMIKSSLGLPASVNQFMGDFGKITPPISLNPSQPGTNNTMALQQQATETDWTGSPTPAALEAKRQIELQTIKDKKIAEQDARTPEEKQAEILKMDELKKKAEDTAMADKNRIANEQSFSQDMLSSISEIEKGIKYFGAAGSIPPLPGEYNKVNWKANFDKIISKNVLQVLNDLKSQSKTGATGFGQLSNKELGVLMNASTVLKKDMSEEDAQKYLNKMKSVFNKVSGEELKSFSNEEEASKANLPKGTIVIINGRKARID